MDKMDYFINYGKQHFLFKITFLFNIFKKNLLYISKIKTFICCIPIPLTVLLSIFIF